MVIHTTAATVAIHTTAATVAIHTAATGTHHSITVVVPTTSVATPITKVTFTVTTPSATRLELLNIKGN